MLWDIGFSLLLDLIVTIILYASFAPTAHLVSECSEELYTAGVVIWAYMVFFTIRDVVTGLMAVFTTQAHTWSYAIRFIWAGFIDGVVLLGLTIWVTTFVANPQPRECSAQDSQIENWWITCIVFLVAYWLYAIYALVITGIMWCVCCMLCCLVCCGGGPGMR